MKIWLLLVTLLFSNVYSQNEQELLLFKQFNEFRQNPKSIIPLLEERLNRSIMLYELMGEGATCSETYIDFSKNEKITTVRKGYDCIKYELETYNELLSVLDTLKPLKPVTFDLELYKVTKKHCDYLNTFGKKYHSAHIGPNNQTTSDRIRPLGYWCFSENVASNITPHTLNGNIEIILLSLLLDQGIECRGHRKNILNPNMTKIAIAYKPGKGYCVYNHINECK
jgi:uncharacterized protein YkwD